ncbi:class I SAM-dependent methyltransferase [Pseudanabaena sp. Chao 1811]|uniref:class I SAM-dependent methyltransferase n=1 Tax=Pseudanabaena sp. Chao 1811 TaxID=2963092 RepID=UPI0022F3F6F6|nr:class I SAM-dependent methyltransferase [Pseudanabaena sp. Chao 1811]
MSTKYRNQIYNKYFSSQGEYISNLDFGSPRRNYYNNYFLTKFLPQDKSTKVLDIGCGCGSLLVALKSLGYSEIMGVDRCPELDTILKGSELSKYIVTGDICDFLKNSYAKQTKWDVVLAIDILEHFTKDELMDVLNLIKNVLSDKGILIIKVPNAQSPLLAGTTVFGDFSHEISFTPTSMDQVLKACGFSDVRYYEASPVPYTPMSILRFCLWNIIRLLYVFLYAVETGSLSLSNVWSRSFFAVANKIDN